MVDNRRFEYFIQGKLDPTGRTRGATFSGEFEYAINCAMYHRQTKRTRHDPRGGTEKKSASDNDAISSGFTLIRTVKTLDKVIYTLRSQFAKQMHKVCFAIDCVTSCVRKHPLRWIVRSDGLMAQTQMIDDTSFSPGNIVCQSLPGTDRVIGWSVTCFAFVDQRLPFMDLGPWTRTLLLWHSGTYRIFTITLLFAGYSVACRAINKDTKHCRCTDADTDP